MRNIILEGPDNAGKSTLAAELSRFLNLPVRHSGGPSKYPGEINHRAKRYIEDKNIHIYDRHPCISQNIYVEALENTGELITWDNMDRFYKSNPIIIYCRSNGSLQGHVQSEHSTEDYFRKVEQSYIKLCGLYDNWAIKKAHFIYRISDGYELVNKFLGV